MVAAVVAAVLALTAPLLSGDPSVRVVGLSVSRDGIPAPDLPVSLVTFPPPSDTGGSSLPELPASGFFSAADVRQLAVAAGFSGAALDEAVIIARCESTFNPNATGAAGERGLWQIHPVHGWPWWTYDPLGNAEAAFRISSGGVDWSPWTCAYIEGIL